MASADKRPENIEMPPLPEENEVVEPVEEPTEQVEPVEELTEQVEPVEEVIEEEVIETTQRKNFRTLREEKEKLQRDHDDALIRLQRYEQDKQGDNQIQQTVEEELEIEDDDFLEGKHYRKLEKKIAKQDEKLQRYEQQVNATTTESRLKAQYSDFDKVVSTDNIKKLMSNEPELAASLSANPDIYSKAVSAYKMIKKLGIYVEDNYVQDRDVAKNNSLKPKPLASVSPQLGSSPLTKANAFANGLTPALKKQLWKEMNECSK